VVKVKDYLLKLSVIFNFVTINLVNDVYLDYSKRPIIIVILFV